MVRKAPRAFSPDMRSSNSALPDLERTRNMPSSYEYQPLNSPKTQIRLLELLPGRGIIQCRLTVVQLREAEGTYEPISYCWKAHTSKYWGACTYKYKKKQKVFRIRIDGADFYITESLQRALQQMRLKTEVRLLWADAICINQADDNEKNAQVAMMGRIYQSGKQTLAWLGDADRWTERAFKYLKEVPHGKSEAPNPTGAYEEPTKKFAHATKGLCAPIHELKYLRHVSGQLRRWLSIQAGLSLLNRPYFKRAWIVQEIVLSDNTVFMCGKHEITWDALHDVICAPGLVLPSRVTLLDHGIGNLWNNLGLYCLDTILSKISHTETSEPRDKLYSALGLHQDCLDGMSVRVDYNKDVDEVFLEATRLILSQSLSLNLLSMSHCTNHSKEKHIQSWVWNPQCGSTEYHLSWAGDSRRTPFNASGGWHSRPQFQDRMVGLLGYVFDVVRTVGQPLPVYRGSLTSSLVLEALRGYFSWVDVSGVYEQDIPEAEAKRRMCAFRCTLTPLRETYDAPDVWYSNWNNEKQENEFALFHAGLMKRFGRFFSTGAPEASAREVLAMWAAFGRLYACINTSLRSSWLGFAFRKDIRAVFGRCFVKTENGDYALCPPDTRPDDKLFLLQGASVPIVLRPSGKNWTLVGECYVYGVMYGELWDQECCEMLWVE